MSRKIRWLLIALLVLAVLLVGAVVTAVWLFDPNEYRERIASEVKQKTGLTLALEGDISLSVFPWLGVDVEQARVENPEGFGPEPLAAIDALQVHARLLPLLRSEVQLRGVRLDGVELNLVRNEQGVGNWEAVQQLLEEHAAPADPDSEAPSGEADLSVLDQIEIGSVELINSSFVFDDRQSGERWAVEPVDLRLGNIRVGEPIDTELTLRLSDAAGDQLRLRLELQAMLDKAVETVSLSGLNLRVDGEQAGFSMDIQAAIDAFALQLDGDAVDVGDFTLGGHVVDPAGDRINLDMGTSIRLDQGMQRLRLDQFRLTANGQRGGGDLDAEIALPQLLLDMAAGQATLAEAVVQINDMRMTLNADVSNLGQSNQSASFRAAAEPFNGRELLQVITGQALEFRDPEALSKLGFEVNGRWQNERAELTLNQLLLDDSRLNGQLVLRPGDVLHLRGQLGLDAIDLDRYQVADDDSAPADEPLDPDAPLPIPSELLRSLDADLAVSAGSIAVAGLRLTEIETRLRALDGVVMLEPIDAQVYGGRFAGRFELDVRGETPHMTLESNLEQVQAGALMLDLTGHEWMTGRGAFSINADTELTSINAAKQALTGGLNLRFADGAIMGISLESALTEAVSRYNAMGEESAEEPDGVVEKGESEQRTDFSVLGVSMSIQDGVFSTDNLNMESALLSLSGSGGFSLADGSVDLRLRPRFNQLPEGINPRIRRLLVGTPIPVRITGPLTQPAYQFDLADALVEGQTDRLKGEVERRAESALRDLLGGGRDEKDEEPAEEEGGGGFDLQ